MNDSTSRRRFACTTELFHLLGDGKRERAAAWRLLRSGAITVVRVNDDDLPDLQALMERYADRPMDFADATLVLLARKLSLADILTVDHDDFETYRIRGKRGFRILPARISGRRRRSTSAALASAATYHDFSSNTGASAPLMF